MSDIKLLPIQIQSTGHFNKIINYLIYTKNTLMIGKEYQYNFKIKINCNVEIDL
jgi:hypothetical protein